MNLIGIGLTVSEEKSFENGDIQWPFDLWPRSLYDIEL